MRTISRDQAIQDLRDALVALVDDEHSLCDVVAKHRIFCQGFKQWSDSELFRKYRWLADRHRIHTRSGLEAAANRWLLARQRAEGLALACDVEQRDHDQCWGWDEWSNEMLERYHGEITGELVHVS